MSKKKEITDPQKKKGTNGVQFIHTPDSINLKRSTKGEYSWDIKIYYDSEEGKKDKTHRTVLERMSDIDDILRKTYINEEE